MIILLHPLFVNEKLITYRDGHFVFGTISENGYEEIKRIKIDKEYYFPLSPGFSGGDLGRKYTRFLYGKRRYDVADVDFIKLDMETFNIKILKFDHIKRGLIRKLSGGEILFIRFKEGGPAEINGVFRFKGDELLPVKVFEDESYEIWKDFDFLKNGIIVRKKKGISIYSLPDFKEQKFKKLK